MGGSERLFSKAMARFCSSICFRAAHLIVRGHAGVLGFDGDGLRGVDTNVDDLVADAQPVELRGFRGLGAEGETAVGVEGHRTDLVDACQSHVLEIEHGVLGVCNLSFNVELFSAAGSQDGRRGTYHQ
jgi:hypothetical protein